MVDPQTILGTMVDGEAPSFNEPEGGVMDHADILRNIQYSLDFLKLVGPVAGLLWFTFFVLGGARK
jgi:hypothetical protein